MGPLQQNQTPTPPLPIEEIKPPHSHKILWILLSVFILLTVAGLFVFKNQIKETSEVSLVQNIAITTDEFADWETMRNEEDGFEFKYPRDWKDLGSYEGLVIQSPYFSQGNTISFYLFEDTDKNTLDEWLKIKFGDSLKLKTTEVSTIVTKEGYKFTQIAHLPDETDDTMVSVIKNGKLVYEFRVSPYSKHVEVYNKILSTFKFVNNYGASESEIRNIVEKSIIKDERSNLDKIKLISARVENENNNLITIKLNFNRDFFVDPAYNGYEGNPYETTLGFIIEGLKPVFKTLYQKTSRQPALDLLENGKERDGMLIDIRFLE